MTNRLILTPSKNCSNRNITSMYVKTYDRAKQITGNHDNQDSLKHSLWYDSNGLVHKMK